MDEVTVLCLACGGGQQSVALALLNANVTVFDLSEGQLDRDGAEITYDDRPDVQLRVE